MGYDINKGTTKFLKPHISHKLQLIKAKIIDRFHGPMQRIQGKVKIWLSHRPANAVGSF